MRLTVGDSSECKSDSVGHSFDYYAVINSLAEENLLKRYVVKRATEGYGDSTSSAAREDLCSTAFKCNFHEGVVM